MMARLFAERDPVGPPWDFHRACLTPVRGR
jgi:hypothetical protein